MTLHKLEFAETRHVPEDGMNRTEASLHLNSPKCASAKSPHERSLRYNAGRASAPLCQSYGKRGENCRGPC